MHVLRLFAAGVFDKFPRLKIIIGHMGEMLPFQLDRIIRVANNQWPMAGVKLEKKLRQVWDENIWITTSSAWSLDPMRCVLRNTKIEHIMYSVDYPFTTNEHGLRWIDELETSGLVTEDRLDLIAFKNAENLLRIKAVCEHSS